MKVRTWLISWLVISLSALIMAGYWVIKIDPFFHYHKPDTDRYFYVINNQRSQNDGISRHFDYNAMITGTSMIENFRTTETDEVFDCKSVKIPFSGATYKEINDNIERALEANPKLSLVIRCLDMDRFLDSDGFMRSDMGDYPGYLYDKNPFNDVKYLLNRDILFSRVYKIISDTKKEGFQPGITAFDDYSRWQENFTFGINTVCPDGLSTDKDKVQEHLSESEKEIIRKNIEANVLSTAEKYPDVSFCYFYSPYSAAQWNNWNNQGRLYKQLEAEELITEMLTDCSNIHLFSFNNRTDITTDLNHYKDTIHYASWINSQMLRWMHDGTYRLTKENYRDYLQQEYDFYTSFDYESMNGQEDYEDDEYAEELLKY